jgi:beta-glucosidase
MTFPVNLMDAGSSANFPIDADTGVYFVNRREDIGQKDVDRTVYAEDIYVGYRWFDKKGQKVSYPFGYGLSYTSFDYSEPAVKAVGDGFEASVKVTNTGKVAGKEVVQLYVSAPAGGLDKPVRELKAYAKTRELQPGESEVVTVKVDAYGLASFNEGTSAWEAAAGEYAVAFGASSRDLRQTVPFTLAEAKSWPVHDVLAPKQPIQKLL